MAADARIEALLEAAIEDAGTGACPPGLGAALRYAMFPGGARIRPQLCLAVAEACGEDDEDMTNAAAAAIEMLHCASLVHDDLPCFDDAPTRRGKPSLHLAFGERLAVLAGDALIVLAFETLARAAAHRPERLATLTRIVAGSVGAPDGIAAGQAWECESHVDLEHYHRAKTGALFAAATRAGAAAAGVDPTNWRTLGDRLGLAYQVADDIRDVAASPEEIGKPTGQDARFSRPSIARMMGLGAAVKHLETLVYEAIDSIPPCPGRPGLQSLMLARARCFLPNRLWQIAA